MTDRGANRALVLGLLALLFGLLSPFAIWTGARSLLRIRDSQGKLHGTLQAATGLAAGAVALLTLVVGVVYWLVAS